MRPRARPAALAAILWLGWAGAAPAQEAAREAAECRLALVLALDVSSSVDPREDLLQRQGVARALVAPEVVRAFEAGGPVALAAFEWSGRWNQRVILDWTMIAGRGDLAAASAAVSGSTRSTDRYPTALGYALAFGLGKLREGPRCWRQVIDVSGDGVNNEGFGPALAYGAFPFGDVTVNGLAIAETDAEGDEVPVAGYYAREVLHGPGAFLEVAEGFDDYERAMRRKLVREVGALAIGLAGPPG